MKSNSWQFKAYGSPGQVLEWRSDLLPEPGPGQAWVKISAVGINRSDLNYVEGRYFPASRFPSCLGTEAVGKIIALGPPANDQPAPLTQLQMAPGARVGTLTERIDQARMGVYRDIGLYSQASLVPIPESYSDAEGAGLWVALLTMGGAMEMGGLTAATASGKTVLITAAASGMGVMALKLARLWGATTIATTRLHSKVPELERMADHVLVCNDPAGLRDGVNRVTDGKGADVVLDPVGADFFPGLLEGIARGGQIVSYECMTGAQATYSIMDLMLKDASLHGYTIFRPFRDPVLLGRLVDIGLDHALFLKPLVSRIFDLEEAPLALEALRRCEHVGKIVLRSE